jgi:hypothetical protein
MTAHGAQPWDYVVPGGRPGDWVVVPDNNTKFPVELPRAVRDVAILRMPTCPWLSTLNQSVGAGYYSEYWGPLPFAFGAVPPERFFVKELLVPAREGSVGAADGAGRGDGQ